MPREFKFSPYLFVKERYGFFRALFNCVGFFIETVVHRHVREKDTSARRHTDTQPTKKSFGWREKSALFLYFNSLATYFYSSLFLSGFFFIQSDVYFWYVCVSCECVCVSWKQSCKTKNFCEARAQTEREAHESGIFNVMGDCSCRRKGASESKNETSERVFGLETNKKQQQKFGLDFQYAFFCASNNNNKAVTEWRCPQIIKSEEHNTAHKCNFQCFYALDTNENEYDCFAVREITTFLLETAAPAKKGFKVMLRFCLSLLLYRFACRRWFVWQSQSRATCTTYISFSTVYTRHT